MDNNDNMLQSYIGLCIYLTTNFNKYVRILIFHESEIFYEIFKNNKFHEI